MLFAPIFNCQLRQPKINYEINFTPAHVYEFFLNNGEQLLTTQINIKSYAVYKERNEGLLNQKGM